MTLTFLIEKVPQGLSSRERQSLHVAETFTITKKKAPILTLGSISTVLVARTIKYAVMKAAQPIGTPPYC
jgi:hypothetical protein